MSDFPDSSDLRLLVLDVDGVLTDNTIFLGRVDGDRVEMKRFNIQDGLGHVLLRDSGVEVVWLSGRHSEATSYRGEELKVAEVVQVAASAKVPALEQLLAARGLDWYQVAFVGDDLADLEVMKRVGLPIAVANARDEIKAVAKYVTTAPGGHGAVREIIDNILKNRGQWEAAVARFSGSQEMP